MSDIKMPELPRGYFFTIKMKRAKDFSGLEYGYLKSWEFEGFVPRVTIKLRHKVLGIFSTTDNQKTFYLGGRPKHQELLLSSLHSLPGRAMGWCNRLHGSTSR